MIQENTFDIDKLQLEEPEAIAFSFDAPGWILLFSIIGIILMVIVIRFIKTYVANAYRREALRYLDQAGDLSDLDCLKCLKRTAVIAYGEEAVGTLFGSTWWRFLDSKIKNDCWEKNSKQLEAVLYEEVQSENDRIKAMTINWIKHHAR